jgi:hypothetical protein
MGYQVLLEKGDRGLRKLSMWKDKWNAPEGR